MGKNGKKLRIKNLTLEQIFIFRISKMSQISGTATVKCYRKDSLDRHIKRHHKDGQPGPSRFNFEPGPSQTKIEPVRLGNGNWGCPCDSYSHKTKSVVIKHIKDVHLGNYIPS